MVNKKGQVIEGLTDTISIVGFVLTAMIFFFLLQIRGCGGSTSFSVTAANGEEIESNNLLLAYIRLPVEVDNKNMTMGSLITEWFLTDDKTKKKYYENIINDKTDSFLDFVPYCSEIHVYHKRKVMGIDAITPIFTSISKYCDYKNYEYFFTCSIMYLPRDSEEKNLKVSACVEKSKIDNSNPMLRRP